MKIASTPQLPNHSPVARAPQLPAVGPADSFAPTSEPARTPGLAPDHAWLAKDPVHTPVPPLPLEAWANAKRFDVAVVGAGMGGLYTAWKLGQQGDQSVGVFERTRHLGGRVHSAPLEGAAIPMDVGAMRLLPSQQPLVANLVHHFQIPTRRFPVAGDHNLNYFRGTRLTNAEVEQHPEKLPYAVKPEERGKSVDALLQQAIGAAIPGFQSMSPQELEAAMKTTKLPVTDPTTGETVQVPLTQLGLQNVLARSLSREAVQLVSDAVGYESDMQNWDAGQAIQELSADYHPGAVYEVPVAGMSALPQALVGDIQGQGTPFDKGKTLRRVDYDAEHQEFQLTFQDPKGNLVPVKAGQVVLNLPKAPLSAVVADSPMLQGTPLEGNLNKVTANPLTRIFVAFDKPWWNEQGIQGGRSTTDLNLGMVYYFGSEGDKRPFLEVYNDGARSQFWEGLQNPGSPGVSTSLNPQPQLAAEVKKELEELHGREIPNPTGLLYKRWSDPYMGGGWHTWNAGSNPLDTRDTMAQPLPGLPLYVVGEAYSTSQGWIEGALQSSERVLEKMKTPS